MRKLVLLRATLSIAAWFLWLTSGCTGNGSGGSAEPESWEQRISKSNLSEDEFTTLCAEAISTRLPEATVTVLSPSQVEVVLGPASSTYFLNDLWDECAHTPSTRGELSLAYIDPIVQAALAKRETPPPVDPNAIVPLVRSEFLVRALRERYKSDGGIVADPLVADLWIVYRLGTEKESRYLTRQEAQHLAIPPNEVRTAAIENLRGLHPKVKLLGKDAVRFLRVDNIDAASLLLLDEAWDGPSKEVKGDLVVAVPERDAIVFTGSDSEASVQALMRSAESLYKKGPLPISKTLLVRRNGAWLPYSSVAAESTTAAPSTH
jgi:uncharacterized protein YtpQ (UPF0354 family)